MNLYLCKKDEAVGYADADTSLRYLQRHLDEVLVSVKKKELEALLWACQMQDEQGKFWCSRDMDMRAFVQRVLKTKVTALQFNEVYSWVYKGAKRGRPSK
jgi:hypothetical protein